MSTIIMFFVVILEPGIWCKGNAVKSLSLAFTPDLIAGQGVLYSLCVSVGHNRSRKYCPTPLPQDRQNYICHM